MLADQTHAAPSPRWCPTPGTRITEHIALDKPIGAGGMASVWLAVHDALETPVAVKLMSPELAANEPALERFRREAQISAGLRHVNIVRVLDAGIAIDGGAPYIVMDYLEGEDLEDYLKREGPLSMPRAVELVQQIASALSAAHAAGIVHRDIKPENVHLSGPDYRHVTLLDFGIAKDMGKRMTQAGAMLGTPQFMSPEQLLGSEEVDHRCDLWALAAVAYYAVTGRLPFEGPGLAALCIAIQSGQFEPPSTSERQLPPGLDAWFHKAFAPQPEDRFQTAEDMTATFTAAALDKKVVAPVVVQQCDAPAAERGVPGPRVRVTNEPTGSMRVRAQDAVAPLPVRRARWGLKLSAAAMFVALVGGAVTFRNGTPDLRELGFVLGKSAVAAEGPTDLTSAVVNPGHMAHEEARDGSRDGSRGRPAARANERPTQGARAARYSPARAGAIAVRPVAPSASAGSATDQVAAATAAQEEPSPTTHEEDTAATSADVRALVGDTTAPAP